MLLGLDASRLGLDDVETLGDATSRLSSARSGRVLIAYHARVLRARIVVASRRRPGHSRVSESRL